MAEDRSPFPMDISPRELCQALLDAAERHGLATEGAEVAWGDVEELFRAAFDLLTPAQRDRFWEDERVADVVKDDPEYETIAAAIYGTRRDEKGGGPLGGSPD